VAFGTEVISNILFSREGVFGSSGYLIATIASILPGAWLQKDARIGIDDKTA
jgi:hypothetical protein